MTLRWGRVALEGGAAASLRWGRVELNGTAAVGLAPLQPQTVEPGTTVTVQAQLTGGGYPDSWTWRQISGPTVTLVTSAGNTAFIAPSAMPPGTSVVIGVRATVGAALSPEQTVTITVLPQLRWIRNTSGVMVGARAVTPQIVMPTVETVPGFVMEYNQDFPVDIAEGGIFPIGTGSDAGLLHPSSAAAIAGYATGPGAFKVKADGVIPEETNSTYKCSSTCSIVDGKYRIRTHFEAGVGVGGALKPIMPSSPTIGQPNYGQNLYGLWRWRRQLLPGGAEGWAGADDLINSNTWGTGTGEYGAENGFASGLLGWWIRPSNHQTSPNNYKVRRNGNDFGRVFNLNDPHTFAIRAEPGRTRLYIDGIVVWEDTVTPISDYLSLVFQYAKPGSPAAGTEAIVEIDWVTYSRWVGV